MQNVFVPIKKCHFGGGQILVLFLTLHIAESSSLLSCPSHFPLQALNGIAECTCFIQSEALPCLPGHQCLFLTSDDFSNSLTCIFFPIPAASLQPMLAWGEAEQQSNMLHQSQPSYFAPCSAAICLYYFRAYILDFSHFCDVWITILKFIFYSF